MRVSASAPRSTPPKKEWTVLYYLDGNNDLEPKLMRNLLDAERVGSSDQVNLVAQISRAPREVVYPHDAAKKTRLDGDWVGARRYYLNANQAGGKGQKKKLTSPALQELPLPDTGSAGSLRDFLQWGMQNYPARHYAVVIGDHGKGFVGTGYDYAHKTVLDMNELKSDLSQAAGATGQKPDLLVFDACLMSQVEVAYQLKDQARYMVASEEIVGQVGLPHADILSILKARPELTPRELAETIVAASADDQLNRMDNGRPDAAYQLSALDLAHMGRLKDACSQLADALTAARLNRRKLTTVLDDVQHFGEEGDKPDSDFKDLGDLLSGLDNLEDLPKSVHSAAEKVSAALQKVVIGQQAEGDGVESATGLSIYCPTRYGHDKRPKGLPVEHWESTYGYGQTDFARDSSWDEWLQALASRS